MPQEASSKVRELKAAMSHDEAAGASLAAVWEGCRTLMLDTNFMLLVWSFSILTGGPNPAARPGDPAARPGNPAARPGNPAARPGNGLSGRSALGFLRPPCCGGNAGAALRCAGMFWAFSTCVGELLAPCGGSPRLAGVLLAVLSVARKP